MRLLILLLASLYTSGVRTEGDLNSDVDVPASRDPFYFNSTAEYSFPPAAKVPMKGFQVVNTSVSWNEALILCKQRSMTLATIRDSNDEAAYTQSVKRAGIDFSKTPYIWTGGTVSRNLSLGWFWSDGEAVLSIPWASGQPDNDGGSENCLSWDPVKFGFNDLTCADSAPFVCEYFY